MAQSQFSQRTSLANTQQSNPLGGGESNSKSQKQLTPAPSTQRDALPPYANRKETHSGNIMPAYING
jgi:hypothetical protein